MFYSEWSKKLIGPNIPSVLVPIETRKKIYHQMYKSVDENGNTIMVQGKVVGSGVETVREIRVAPSEVKEVLKKLNEQA